MAIKKEGKEFFILVALSLFLIIINSYFISAQEESSCEQCGKGMFNFCNQNKCEKIEGCMFIERNGVINKILKIGECVSEPRLSPADRVVRSLDYNKPYIGVGCPLRVNLSVNVTDERFYVIEEDYPDNWNVDNPGEGNTNTAGKIKYVRYDDNDTPVNEVSGDTRYTYIITPTSSAIGDNVFSGIYTMGDDLTETIIGTNSIDVIAQICGDGALTCNEQCDDGNTINNDACDNLCQIREVKCGNGVVEQGEQCDDGNANNNDACKNDCKLNICGDGFVNSGVETCDDGNNVNGDGCSSTCKNEPYYKVFVTKDTFKGNLTFNGKTGYLGGDAICKTKAIAAGMPSASKWVAWLSDSNHNIGNGRMYWTGLPYKTLDGRVIAKNWNDLIDGSLDAPINVNELNQITSGESVWTGTLVNGGSASGVQSNCNYWSASGGASGLSGNSSSITGKWTNEVLLSCSIPSHLYCFEQPWCGNGICESARYAYETCSNCRADCGICPPPPPTPTCFAGDTKIKTKDGDIQIKDIKEGEIVLSYNEETGKIESSKVTKTFEHVAKGYLIINNKVRVTSNHPMHINGEWKEIGKAKIGDKIKTSNGEEIIRSIEIVNENIPVYNLEVEGNHNYYAENYLAHNKINPEAV